LGIARYETAWLMLHKLRRAMLRPDREPLHLKVEVDETCVGGREEGKRGGREIGNKALVIGAVEVRGTASGRIRLQVVSDASGPSLGSFVKLNVEQGAVVITDAWKGYTGLSDMGYRHEPHVQGGPEGAEKYLPRIHRAFGNLKTWLLGTHHGIGKKHMQAYLNEFAFRFNRRRTPKAAFQTLLGLGSQRDPTTYDDIVELTG